jgi:hypothetical protein
VVISIVVCIWSIELFISSISGVSSIFPLSLLNFSSRLLTFLHRSWIVFLTSFICLFQSLGSLITFQRKLLNSSSDIQPFQCLSVWLLNCYQFWRSGISLFFTLFESLCCVLCISWGRYHFHYHWKEREWIAVTSQQFKNKPDKA